MKNTTRNRLNKAKAAALFSRIEIRNIKGQATSVLVPGSDAKRYEVVLRRNGWKMSAECRLETGKAGYQDCKGNAKTVCYHSLAAIIAAAQDAGRSVSICETKEDAFLLARTSRTSQVIEIVSHQTSNKEKEFFAVVK